MHSAVFLVPRLGTTTNTFTETGPREGNNTIKKVNQQPVVKSNAYNLECTKCNKAFTTISYQGVHTLTNFKCTC